MRDKLNCPCPCLGGHTVLRSGERECGEAPCSSGPQLLRHKGDAGAMGAGAGFFWGKGRAGVVEFHNPFRPF